MFFGTPSINSYKDKIWVISEMPYFCKLVSKNHCLSFMSTAGTLSSSTSISYSGKYHWNILAHWLCFPVQEFGVYLSFCITGRAVPCFKTQRFLFLWCSRWYYRMKNICRYLRLPEVGCFFQDKSYLFLLTLCKRECTYGCLTTYKSKDMRGKTAIVASSVDHPTELDCRVKIGGTTYGTKLFLRERVLNVTLETC